MAHLVDTNVLVRLANTADGRHAEAARAVVEMHRRGEVLHVTPQVLIEFRNVATRPATLNGLGLSPTDAELLTTIHAATPTLFSPQARADKLSTLFRLPLVVAT